METKGLYQVLLPLSFWNDQVHAYLGKRDGKWTIVDTGIYGVDTRKRWELVFAQYGIDPTKDIERILVTHHHADHFGFAGEMQEWTGVEVLLPEAEQELAERTWTKEGFRRFYQTTGLPDAMIDELQDNATAMNQQILPVPSRVRALQEGDSFFLGELLFEAINMPGHTSGHICFYNREEQILISGDHFTREVVPYISYHGYGDTNPLATYLATLRQMKSMEISLVLPGHGPAFADAPERLNELISHFESRLGFVCQQVTKEMTAYEVSRTLATKELATFQQWILLGETNAYLHYLVASGELCVVTESGVCKYSRIERALGCNIPTTPNIQNFS
ncbi:MBL fold metallo-hydrolase [Brevibacillus choshinensis]|uniref:MBL fold metallo-hydrolase n=1 Tax=Brevibacillus choshinensis TaxID=54911 RepID=UPI002E1CC611|nr:MBL fold metallo-hydrolase [Brevibacillus choshinensis]